MKYLRKFLLSILVLLSIFIFFLPKVQLYYLAEKYVEEEKIILSGETTNDSGFIFNITGGTLFYDDFEVLQLNNIRIIPLIFFNSIDISPFNFSEDVQSFIPKKVEKINIRYTLIDPFNILITADGDFGSLNSSITFLDHHILAELTPSKRLLKIRPIWLKEFKKQEGGVYKYESTY